MDPLESNHGLLILENDYHFFDIKSDLETYPSDMIPRINDKLIEIVESEQFKFKTVVLKLVLMNEYTVLKKYDNSLDILEDLECELKTLRENDCDSFPFKEVSKALRMILKTCKAYILISQNKEKKAREITKKIIPYADLDTISKASVYGIRSMVFIEYGLYGHKMALEYAEKAKKLDPKNPYWHFLIGKALGRIRRVEKPFEIPSDEERNALQTAIQMNENYLFMLFTAESYVETSSRTYRFHNKNRSLYGNLKVRIDQMNEEASNLYKKCLEKEPNCSHVLFRAARGFLNLPHPQRDAEKAKELLSKGMKSNPRNPFANHLLAKYYERFDKNIPKAIEHLKICSEQKVFGAEMDLLRLEFSKDGVEINPIERLEKLLDVYTEEPRKIQLLSQMVSFYIFVDPDLPKACQILKQAITSNCDDNILNHRSMFLRVRQPFSILDVLVDELKIQMERGCPKETKNLYESFLFDLNESQISILKGRAKNLKAELLEEDEQTRLGNYYRKPTNTNRPSQMRRRSFAKPIPKSAPQQKIEKARSVQQVDDFFDSWLDGEKKTEKRNGFSRTNNSSSKSSLNGSCSDLSPSSDSRFLRSQGQYDRNRNYDRYSSRQNNDPDAESDRSGDLKKSTKHDNVVEEFDRLSISSNRSGFSNSSRSRGKSSYSNPRPRQDGGDFDRSSFRRDARRFDSNDNRSNFSDRSDSKFPTGKGHTDNNRTNNTRFTRDKRTPENSPHQSSRNKITSNGSRCKTTDQLESTRTNTSDRKNTCTNSKNERNSENASFKNWRSEMKSRDEMKDQQRSKNLDEETTSSHVIAKAKSKPPPSEDSDSDDDLMSYFKKK